MDDNRLYVLHLTITVYLTVNYNYICHDYKFSLNS